VTGTVVALAADGTELARAQACTYDEASAFGCGGGGGVTQLAPIPGPSASG